MHSVQRGVRELVLDSIVLGDVRFHTLQQERVLEDAVDFGPAAGVLLQTRIDNILDAFVVP